MTASAPLHARTLFGDLQFVHALTGDPAQPVVESLDDIYRWLEFTWRVAVGDIGANVKLSEVDLEGFAALFPAQADWTVGKFFAAEGSPDVSERALGAFLHTVQDSYAQTHLQRATDDLGRAYVRNIGTVAKGNHSGHANDPGWRDGWTEGVILWEVAPAMTGAFQRAVDLTRLAGYRRGWPAARAYLEMHVLPTFAPKDDRR